MAFDFKKEYKEYYMTKNTPEIVTVQKANYIAVRGKGNPQRRRWDISASSQRFVCSSLNSKNEL